ncbi:Lipase 1 [Tolypocladium ophioglossoides CBS 100239]|uniref:Lipase 1 n=1 Tax=Tolypocladium ophioglossoides (strain CBS 100239) TaxID=1163406 RepID=A0A0L0NH62_TOLOC|nr:Lipase 1 [Tolypocladium ophioglossoides CBS 100239]
MSVAGLVIARPPSENFATISLLLRDTDDDFFPEDLSFFTKLAAVGDSYSAGIGAGDRLGGLADWACSRYDHAYPNLINEDPRLGDKSNRKFQFHSCSGAVIKDILDEQIPRVDSSQQAILLSAGGNDAELLNILNQCIFQWSVFNKEQVAAGKLAELLEEPWAKNVDFDVLGRGCDGQLKISRAIIESNDFSSRLDAVIAAAKKKLAPDGMIYYTGYAKFFDTRLGPECDKVSWATWIYKTHNIFHKEEYLTSAHRKEMHELVDLINSKLEAAVERAGPQVEFVNYDPYVGRYHGRYCEAGVSESSGESNTRKGLMFYELNTLDPLGSNPWKRSANGSPSGTFVGDENLFARVTRYLDPDAQLVQEHRVEKEAQQSSTAVELPNFLPDGYGRVFHPQILLHEIISNLIIYRMTNRRLEQHGYDKAPEVLDKIESCPYTPPKDAVVLHYGKTQPGKAVKQGTELRILPVGDSITVGFLSGDGNGYRGQLKKDLSMDDVVFAGTESSGTMSDGYYAAWSGVTIQYISDHVGPSLEQRPNIILLAAGTNDMNPNHSISKEGNNPSEAADRLGKLIDKMIKECPDAVILVAMIINTCDPQQSSRTEEFQQLIPGVVKKRKDASHQVLAVDFTTFETSNLQDCIHPTNEGYKIMGDYWYDFIHQIPSRWIKKPVGSDPNANRGEDNGGIDKNIPPPVWGESPVQPTSKESVLEAFRRGNGNTKGTCKGKPIFRTTGQIALGLGSNGDWKYHKYWKEAGKVAEGLHLDPRYVRLHDMNGDGKAEIRCWLNNLPEPWSPAGTNNGIIGSGAGPAKSVFIADMNGDGLEDYMVVNTKNGAVKIWWNYGPDDAWVNGWKFVEGEEIATGVPHANWDTLRFPDINGDGRADYVYIGEGGALKHYMNTGTVGGQDVLFLAQGGIATGASPDITKLVFADMNGDGRDDYLIWDEDGGLTGFLNQPTQREGVPVYIDQGPAKTLADGISKDPGSIRLADMDGDGKDDYAYIDENGGISLWYNRGHGDTSLLMDNIHFADLYGEGQDSFVWLDTNTGAPTVYYNAGDGMDDYLVVDPKTGELTAYLNEGEDHSAPYTWHWKPVGSIASGLGPGRNVRFADIDGDGRADYIYLNRTGGTTIYRNIFQRDGPGPHWVALPEADAFGISQRPEEISFHDINHDGKADYVWTSAIDGSVQVWLNNYPNKPAWLPQGNIATGVGISGSCVKWASLLRGNYSDYVAFNPRSGAFAGWLNLRDDPLDNPPPPGTKCKKDFDCHEYDCPTDKYSGCVINGLGGGKDGTCQCVPQK